jgi:hypothetical protein
MCHISTNNMFNLIIYKKMETMYWESPEIEVLSISKETLDGGNSNQDFVENS